MGLNSRQIEQFLCVVESGGLTKASGVLNISQPALTKSLRHLEQELKVKLLERHSRGMRPTIYGECLYDHAKRVDAELDRARSEIEALRGARKGSVAVGVIPLIAKSYLPSAIVRLMKVRPEVTVSVTELNNSDLVPAFRRGQFDFIVGILANGPLEDGMQQNILFYDELVITVRRNHPLVRSQNLNVRELGKYPWIYPRLGSAHRQRIDEYFRLEGSTPPAATVEGGSETFIQSILADSDLVAVLPKGLIHDEGSDDGIMEISLNSPVFRRPIGIMHRGASNLSPLSRILITEIQNSCRNVNGGFESS